MNGKGNSASNRFNPVSTNERPRSEKLKQRLWGHFQAVFFQCTPFFARRMRVWAIRLWGGVGVSYQSGLSRLSRIDYPWNFSIGTRSSVGDHAWVYAIDKISIGDKCCIGDDVRLLTGTHDTASPKFHLVTRPIRIDDCVWVATGVTILPGVHIGEGAVIGAGSIVAKDVPPWTIVVGNPAHIVKQRQLTSEPIS